MLEAISYAYDKGIEIDLNPNYRVLDTNIIVSNEHLRASVWINFKEDGLHSKLTLEKLGKVVFEKELDETKNGVEYFLELYKSIEVESNHVVLKGRKELTYLPFRIPIDELPL